MTILVNYEFITLTVPVVQGTALLFESLYPANCRPTTYRTTTPTQHQYHSHNKLPRNSPIKREGMIIKSSSFTRISHSRTKETTILFICFLVHNTKPLVWLWSRSESCLERKPKKGEKGASLCYLRCKIHQTL